VVGVVVRRVHLGVEHLDVERGRGGGHRGGEQQPAAGEQQQGDEREGADTGVHCLVTPTGPASIPR